LVDLTGLTSEIVKGILAGAEDIEVVGELSMREVGGPDRSVEVDVAILDGDDQYLSRRAYELLTRQPLLRVLAIVAGGREGSLYELRPQRTPLGELSSEALLDAVRTGRAIWA
jgi:hypothetical protein